MKIAIAQINVTVGDFEGNSARIIKDIERAERSGAELVVFPEMAITGYPTRDLLEKPHFVSRNMEAVAKIAEKLGFKFLRQVGSHMMYEHSDGRKKAMKNRFA